MEYMPFFLYNRSGRVVLRNKNSNHLFDMVNEETNGYIDSNKELDEAFVNAMRSYE